MLELNKLYNVDCLDGLHNIDDNSIHLIITSPPYADKRKNTYGGVKPEKYVEWFMPIADQLFRVLNNEGSFFLNIKEGVKDYERETYVLELLIELRKHGWSWTDEFIWVKKNPMPSGWNNRFKDGWERVYQFNKTKNYYINKDAVKKPYADSTKSRLTRLCDNDLIRTKCNTGSGFNRLTTNFLKVDEAYPSNVLYFSTETQNVGHPAVFPRNIPRFFIKAYSRINDIVLDPFMGSGTTALEAIELNRNYIGFEKMPQYIKTFNNRVYGNCMTLDSFVKESGDKVIVE